MSIDHCKPKKSLCRKSVFGTFLTFAFVFIVLLSASIAANAQFAAVNDGHGKEWRQLTTTAGLSWNQTALVCPQDGVGRCSGLLLGDWTWATDAQVLQLMSYTEPAMATNRSVSGFQYLTTAGNFLNIFSPTASGCNSSYTSFGCFASLSGWTATMDINGYPIVGSVGKSESNFGFSGGFDVSLIVNPNAVDNSRGVWLWRDPNGIFANDDYGQVASPDGGIAVTNVLANDRIAGTQASFANVAITQISSTTSGVNLNTATGEVSVLSGTPAGTYSLVYRMCSLADTAFCDDATVTVLVKPYTVDAVDDYGIISPSVGGSAIASVLANDTFSGGGANFGNVTLSLVSITPNNGGVTLDLSNGSVDVARGTAVGNYAVVYRICTIVVPTLCDQATATITVRNYSIDAVDDYVRASSKVANSPINVLANDTFNGGRATVPTIRLSQVSAAIPGITLNTSTGVVSIAAKTQSGLYNLVYKICETAGPTNCDTATAILELSGR